jgi:hypothetical protein
MANIRKPFFPNSLEVHINLLSIPELLKQLSKYKPDYILLHIMGKGHKRHFPQQLQVIDCNNFEIYTRHPVDGTKDLTSELQGSKFITFDDFGEGYEHIFYHDGVAGDYGDAEMPNHLTVADLIEKLQPFNSEKNYFIIQYNDKGYVSPDLMMNYNNATYKVTNKDKQIFKRDVGMEGMVCFGLGNTMSNDYGSSVIYLKPKGSEEKMIQEQKEYFNRFASRKK